MKKLLIVVLALVFAVGLSAGQAFAIGYCKDALEAGNAGGPGGLKTFDDTVLLNEGAQVCIDIWVNDIPNPTLLTSGYWITFDPAKLQLDSFAVYTTANGGPWDNAGTTIVADPAGPGTYFGTSVQFATVPVDAGGDIIIGKVCVTCIDGNVDADIKVKTVPGFDTVVGDSVVFDPQIVENTLAIDQQPPPPCVCTALLPATATLQQGDTQQYTPQVSGTCEPNNFQYTTTCTQATISGTGLLTVGAVTATETCTVTATDLANTGVVCSADVEIQFVTCDGEIALGRECPGETIDDPAYNRPGRRGLAATCDDIIDFTVCNNCGPDWDPSCLVWTTNPVEPFLQINQIDDCCWRLEIGDTCSQLEKIKTYEITVTDTCNNWSDTVAIEIGKVIVDIGDTTVQPNTESATVDINLINPEHHVRAMAVDVEECQGGADNMVCTECLIDPARALDFTCSANEQPDGSCRVVLYATNPAALILQGRGTVAQVVYQAGDADIGSCVCLRPVNIQMSDQFNEDLCACQSPGEVCFRTCGDIYPQDCLGGPCGDVTNCGDGVVDLFDILEAVDIILGLQTASLCQIGNGDVPNGMPPYCGNPPGTPNCESDGDIDIFDVLVMIDKALGKMNCCDYCLFGNIF